MLEVKNNMYMYGKKEKVLFLRPVPPEEKILRRWKGGLFLFDTSSAYFTPFQGGEFIF